MNWDDPEARLALIERVGAKEYTRLFNQHHKDSTVATVNGYPIRPVISQFGRLFAVGGTDMAFNTLQEATEHAQTLPSRS